MAEPETTREGRWLYDYATIFAHTWYRDFPTTKHRLLANDNSLKVRRADWTIHLGIAVRSTADLMGLFAHFESGKKTDAVLKDASGASIAAVEWEWIRLHRQPNELTKLIRNWRGHTYPGLRFMSLVGYSREDESASDVDGVLRQWEGVSIPLLLVVVHFRWEDKRRRFTKLTLHEIRDGCRTLLREQPAYPWDVKGSRWASDGAPSP